MVLVGVEPLSPAAAKEGGAGAAAAAATARNATDEREDVARLLESAQSKANNKAAREAGLDNKASPEEGGDDSKNGAEAEHAASDDRTTDVAEGEEEDSDAAAAEEDGAEKESKKRPRSSSEGGDMAKDGSVGAKDDVGEAGSKGGGRSEDAERQSDDDGPPLAKKPKADNDDDEGGGGKGDSEAEGRAADAKAKEADDIAEKSGAKPTGVDVESEKENGDAHNADESKEDEEAAAEAEKKQPWPWDTASKTSAKAKPLTRDDLRRKIKYLLLHGIDDDLRQPGSHTDVKNESAASSSSEEEEKSPGALPRTLDERAASRLALLLERRMHADARRTTGMHLDPLTWPYRLRLAALQIGYNLERKRTLPRRYELVKERRSLLKAKLGIRSYRELTEAASDLRLIRRTGDAWTKSKLQKYQELSARKAMTNQMASVYFDLGLTKAEESLQAQTLALEREGKVDGVEWDPLIKKAASTLKAYRRTEMWQMKKEVEKAQMGATGWTRSGGVPSGANAAAAARAAGRGRGRGGGGGGGPPDAAEAESPAGRFPAPPLGAGHPGPYGAALHFGVPPAGGAQAAHAAVQLTQAQAQNRATILREQAIVRQALRHASAQQQQSMQQQAGGVTPHVPLSMQAQQQQQQQQQAGGTTPHVPLSMQVQQAMRHAQSLQAMQRAQMMPVRQQPPAQHGQARGGKKGLLSRAANEMIAEKHAEV